MIGDRGPCAQIAAACQGAGFALGTSREGASLQADCIAPIMQGTSQRRRARQPLPEVDPRLVADSRPAILASGRAPDREGNRPRRVRRAKPAASVAGGIRLGGGGMRFCGMRLGGTRFGGLHTAARGFHVAGAAMRIMAWVHVISPGASGTGDRSRDETRGVCSRDENCSRDETWAARRAQSAPPILPTTTSAITASTAGSHIRTPDSGDRMAMARTARCSGRLPMMSSSPICSGAIGRLIDIAPCHRSGVSNFVQTPSVNRRIESRG